MPKLPLIGSIVAIGGTAGIGGLAWDSSNPKSQTVLSFKKKEQFVLKRCVLYSIVKEADLTVKREEESSFAKEINNDSLWGQVNKDCGVKERIFLAKKSEKWVYEERLQGLAWKIN
ncbi:hypothetical protein HF1_03760 [Mycoplasma haemofelis str. Langford 1]|uniref:Uncharacterized protein n=1 Tax=Mycoplasma haemofelis (strain Langford 1) TaxID=941640 RepID=E8ZGW3_MYCHL|nr:hypothetical protein [Mycoplasma haemofelis]CBY92384.1 hypothetical protein HF1_03760 [Mycoplasma haemofelis str. Langford 1]